MRMRHMHKLLSLDKDMQYAYMPYAWAHNDAWYDNASRSLLYLCQASQCMRSNKPKQNQCCLFLFVMTLTPAKALMWSVGLC